MSYRVKVKYHYHGLQICGVIEFVMTRCKDENFFKINFSKKCPNSVLVGCSVYALITVYHFLWLITVIQLFICDETCSELNDI